VGRACAAVRPRIFTTMHIKSVWTFEALRKRRIDVTAPVWAVSQQNPKFCRGERQQKHPATDEPVDARCTGSGMSRMSFRDLLAGTPNR
jgi:hypothetical protein